MSRVERGPRVVRPIDVEPGAVGPGPDELVGSGEIDEPVPQGMFLELLELMTRLKARRLALGLSQAEVSERSGLNRQGVNRLENGWNGNPTLETLYRYAMALGMGLTLGLEELDEVEAEDDVSGGAPRG